MENNRVASLDAIRGLKACKSLRVLSLVSPACASAHTRLAASATKRLPASLLLHAQLIVHSQEGNPLAETDGYGEVWKVLPHLEVVDHKDQDGQEVVNDEDDDEDDDDEGGEGEGGDDEDEPGLEALVSTPRDGDYM